MDERSKTKSYAVEPLKKCSIEAILPEGFDVSLEDLVKHDAVTEGDGASRSLVAAVPQRTSVYLDETIDACLIFICPYQREDNTKSFLASLEIKVEAYGTVLGSRDAKGSNAAMVEKQLITSAAVEGDDLPEVVLGHDVDADAVEGGKAREGDGRGPVYVLWRKRLHIARSRIRASLTHIYLTAVCGFKDTKIESSTSTDYYIPPTPNLLAPLSSDPSFIPTSSSTSTDTVAPVLPAARLQKHIPPNATLPSPPTVLRSANRKFIPLQSVLTVRLGCETIGESPSTKRMLIALNLEAAASLASVRFYGEVSAACVVIESIDLTLAKGSIESISGLDEKALMRLLADEASTIAYELHLSPLKMLQQQQVAKLQDATGHPSTEHVLGVRVIAAVQGMGSSEPPVEKEDRRRLQIQFRTTLDLSPLHQRLAKQIDPSRADVSLRKHELLLTVKTIYNAADNQGVYKWSVTLTNQSERVRNLQIKPLMIHEVDASSGGRGDKTEVPGPTLVPLTPTLDFGDVGGHGGTSTSVVGWTTVDAALSKQKQDQDDDDTKTQLGRVGGLRVVDLGVRARRSSKHEDGREGGKVLEAKWQCIDVFADQLPHIFIRRTKSPRSQEFA